MNDLTTALHHISLRT